MENSKVSTRCKKCSVKGCHYERTENKVSLFGIPWRNKDLVESWRKAISREKPFSKYGKICANHFAPSDISYVKTVPGMGGKGVIFLGNYKVPQLRENAIPSTNLPKKQTSSTASEDTMETLKNANLQHEVGETETENVPELLDSNISGNIENESEKTNFENSAAETLNVSKCNTSSNSNSLTTFVNKAEETSIIESFTLEQLHESLNHNEKLTKWKSQILRAENGPSRSVLSCSKDICRIVNGRLEVSTWWKIVLSDDFALQVSFKGLPTDPTEFCIENALGSIEGFVNFVIFLDNFRACPGVRPNFDASGLESPTVIKENSNTWRHVNCPVILQHRTFCKVCPSVSKMIYQKRRRINISGDYKLDRENVQEKIKDLKKEIYSKNRACKRWHQKVEEYKVKLNKFAKENVVENELKRLDVGAQQQETVKQIMRCAKANSKNGVRYSQQWISNCIQIRSKSPSSYRMIRDMEILPLPSSRTLARITSGLNTTT